MGYREILLQRKQAETANQDVGEQDNLPEQKDVQDVSRNQKFFGIENANHIPLFIDLRLTPGKRRLLPYANIVDGGWDSSDGIDLITPTKKIIIEGRNLEVLFDHLVSHRLKYIKANVGNDLSESRELFVKTIKIEEL